MVKCVQCGEAYGTTTMTCLDCGNQVRGQLSACEKLLIEAQLDLRRARLFKKRVSYLLVLMYTVGICVGIILKG